MDTFIDYLTSHFYSVDQINDAWVKATQDNNYTEFDDFQSSVEVDFLKEDEQTQLDQYKRLCRSILKYQVSDTSNGAELWKQLMEKSVSAKKISLLLWYSIELALAKESTAPRIKCGVHAACAYMYLCSLNGAQAYHIFNPYLYMRSLELFRMIYRDLTYDNHRVVTKKPAKPKGKPNKKKAAEETLLDQTDAGIDKIEWDKAELVELLEDCTKSMFVLTDNVALSAFMDAANSSILLARDLAYIDAARDTRVTKANSINEFSNLARMSDRAFALIHRLCEERHSPGGVLVYSRFVYPRLAFLGTDMGTVPSSASIPASYTQWKDLILHFIEVRVEDASKAEMATIMKVLENVYCRCIDRQDYRTKIATTLVQALLVLPVKFQYDFIQRVDILSHQQKTSLRNLAIDMVPILLKSIDFTVPDPVLNNADNNMDETNELTAANVAAVAADCDMNSDEDDVEKSRRPEVPKKKGKKAKKDEVVPRVEPLPAMYNCIVRCCADKSAAIRGRGLLQMSALLADRKHAGGIVASADAMHQKYPRMFVVGEEKKTAQVENDDEEDDIDLDETLAPINNVILHLIMLGLEDEKANVRKAALLAAQAYIPSIDTMVDFEPLIGLIKARCVDASLLVRKQAADSVTVILEQSQYRDEMESVWLGFVLPMINDREQSVQNVASKLVADTIVNPILGETTAGAWSLMSRIEQEDNHRRLLVRALFHQSKENQLNSRVVDVLYKKLDSDPERSDVIWMLLAELSVVFKICPKSAIIAWNNMQDGDVSNMVRYVAKVLTSTTEKMTDDQKKRLSEDIRHKISHYYVDASHISTVYLCLAKLLDAVGEGAKGWAILREFGREMLQDCRKQVKKALDEFTLDIVIDDGDSVEAMERRLVRVITTIGEIIQYSPNLIDGCAKLIEALKTIMAADEIQHDPQLRDRIINSHVPSMNPSANPSRAPSRMDAATVPPTQSSSFIGSQPLSSQGGPIIPAHVMDGKHFVGGALFTPLVRAYCVLAIGKFCLMDEMLAKECVPVYVRQLRVNPDHVIRNNIMLVICDLCTRYTSLVDRYSPIIAGCLKDRSTLVRLQTLESLTNLIKEQFIRWEGQIMYRFVSTILDENKLIREYSEFCLKEVLLLQFPTMFYHHFIECLIYFNEVPKKFMSGATEEMDVDAALKFSLGGDKNVPIRMKLYKFMLATFEDKDKFITMSNICRQVLQPVLTGELSFNDARVVALLKDAFDIMASKEIELHMDVGKAPDDDEEEAPAALVALAKQKITETFRKGIIECIMPPLLDMRTFLTEQRSPLIQRCFAVLRSICRQHREQIDDFLAGDQQLKAEIEYELKRFEVREKAERIAAKKAEEEARVARRLSRRSFAVAKAIIAGVDAIQGDDEPMDQDVNDDDSNRTRETTATRDVAATAVADITADVKPDVEELNRSIQAKKSKKKGKKTKIPLAEVKEETADEMGAPEPIAVPSFPSTTDDEMIPEGDEQVPQIAEDVPIADNIPVAEDVPIADDIPVEAIHTAIEPTETDQDTPRSSPLKPLNTSRSGRRRLSKDNKESHVLQKERTFVSPNVVTRRRSKELSVPPMPVRSVEESARKRGRSDRESTVERWNNEPVVTGRAISTPNKTVSDVTFADLNLSAIHSDDTTSRKSFRSRASSRAAKMGPIDED